MNAVLTLTGLGSPEITLTAEARRTRDALLAEAGECTAVGDQLDADAAAAVLQRLKGWTRQIEAGRATAKAPVLALSRKIDGLAAELVAPVEAQSQRISRLLGEYQAEARRKAAEKLREHQRQEEALRRQAAAEMAAIEREASGSAEAEARKEAVVQQYQQQVAEGRQALIAAAPPRIAGTAVREDWKFEVTDIQALYRAHPQLVVLQPNHTAIRAIVKHNQNIPGLRVWKEASTIIRH